MKTLLAYKTILKKYILPVKGLNKVLNNLKKFGKEGEKEIEIITKSTASEIVVNAKQKAPVNLGKLRESIAFEENKSRDDISYTIFVGGVGQSYAAYVEFGTGSKVKVPSELSKEAAKFRGGRGGTFEQGLQSIKDWCRAKGIPEDAAYPIFISILNEGIAPQPYLYPAWVKGKIQYLKDLKQGLNRLVKKYE